METKIYTYKYMWHRKDKPDSICYRVICGVQEEHDEFVNHLVNSDEVVMASRVYINEIDCELVDKLEFIKEGGEENEKSE